VIVDKKYILSLPFRAMKLRTIKKFYVFDKYFEIYEDRNQINIYYVLSYFLFLLIDSKWSYRVPKQLHSPLYYRYEHFILNPTSRNYYYLAAIYALRVVLVLASDQMNVGFCLDLLKLFIIVLQTYFNFVIL